MLQLFRINSPYAVIALFLTAICVKLSYLIHPELPIAPDHQTIWAAISPYLGTSAFGLTFLAIINITGQALYLNRIAGAHQLYASANYLPALTFVLATSMMPQWNYLSASLVANWFLLAALHHIFQLYLSPDARKQLFNAGFFIACATLLVLSNLLLLILLFAGIALLRPFKIQEWLLAIAGFLLPFYFWAGYLYLTDQTAQFLDYFVFDIHLFSWRESWQEWLLPAGWLILLFILGGIALFQYTQRMLIQTKKNWGVVWVALVVSLAAAACNLFDRATLWLPAILWASLVIANIWVESKYRWFGRILFYLFIGVVIFAAFYPR